MEKRVKVFFESENVFNLEKSINRFLAHTEGRLVDIKYDAIINGNDWGPSALLIYIPQEFIKKEEKKDEKENKSAKENEKSDARVQRRRAPQRKQEGASSKESRASSSNRSIGSKKSGSESSKKREKVNG